MKSPLQHLFPWLESSRTSPTLSDSSRIAPLSAAESYVFRPPSLVVAIPRGSTLPFIRTPQPRIRGRL